jgi:4-amino-4-deoxy-L-arabinose transferase-like glycosyltransferase
MKTFSPAFETPYSRKIWYLIIIATAIRLLISGIMELSNDEVYYWTYALFPDLSHFGHPPMVGIVIYLSTFGLHLDNELFVRLGSVMMSAFNTFMAYKIGVKLRNEQTGYFAALLYSASIYASILAGTFIIPDSPQLFFWMLAIWFYLNVFSDDLPNKKVWSFMILGGLSAALAILSKYHSVFILSGVGLYVLIFDQKWLKHPAFYLSVLIAIGGAVPILIWNIQNEFISFTFHGDRVTPALRLRPDYFFREIGGQVAYNNPVNFFLIVMSFVGIIKGRKILEKKILWFFILTGLPLILVFTGFSLFRETLPHWSGPGYLPLIFVAATYLNARYQDKTAKFQWSGTPKGLQTSIYLILFLLIVAVWLINFSPLKLGKTSPVEKYGEYDFTQDMYGWEQLGQQVDSIVYRNELPQQDFIGQKWFPGAHVHYYVAKRQNAKMYMIGDLKSIHKYAWINADAGEPQKGKSYYHLAVSNYYRDPIQHFTPYFRSVEVIDTLEVYRAGKLMRYGFLMNCKDYNGQYDNPL